jgi:hypothetical protein
MEKDTGPKDQPLFYFPHALAPSAKLYAARYDQTGEIAIKDLAFKPQSMPLPVYFLSEEITYAFDPENKKLERFEKEDGIENKALLANQILACDFFPLNEGNVKGMVVSIKVKGHKEKTLSFFQPVIYEMSE